MSLINKKQSSRPRQRVLEDAPVKMTTYYRSGNDKKDGPPPKRRKKSRTKAYLRLVDIVGVLAIFGLFGYSLLISNHPKVVVSNTEFNSPGIYRDATSELMSGVGSRNKITFNEQKLVKDIKTRFPEVSGVSVELPLLSPEAIVRLQITNPIFILNNSGSLLVVGDSGRAIAPAKNFARLADLPVVNDETGYRAVLGRQVMGENGTNFIQALVEACRKHSITVQAITLPPLAQELHLRAADQTYYIKFLLSGDAGVQIGQFLAAREKFSVSGERPAEYLDVRVPGKIYYK